MTKQNWNEYRNKIRTMLLQIDNEALLELVGIFMGEDLNLYKLNHPEVDWLEVRLRQVKETINNKATPIWQTPLPEARITYDVPGSSELIRAMERLWRLPTAVNDREYFISLVEASIFESISSILVFKWAQSNPNQWNKLKNQNYIASVEFRNSETVKQTRQELSEQLMGEIEKLIGMDP